MRAQKYATKDAFQVYQTYLALKRHFQSDGYDFFKYQGRVKADLSSFKKRNDVYFFYRLSKEVEWHEILLANVVKNSDFWIGDMTSSEAESIWRDWKKRKESLEYTFRQEIKHLKFPFKINFVVDRNDYPYIMKLFMRNTISLEVFTILSSVTNAIPYWENKIEDTIIAPDIIRKVKKYNPFLGYDISRYSMILKELKADNLHK